MSTESLIFDTFASLFADRVYADEFRQVKGVVAVPSARFTIIGGTIDQDIAGAGFETTDDISFQLDVVAATPAARAALRTQVRAAAEAGSPPPMVLRSPPTQQYDVETKTYRETFEFTIYGSD